MMKSIIPPCVSIIVPIYKAEEFLPKCINSILSQTYTNFELLLIDDGSPDNSGKICDEYASNDSRIRVFHKQNAGVSSARNLGLREARGEWISWVDADDWIENNMLESMINKALQDSSDLVMCDYKWVGKEWNSNNIIENIVQIEIDVSDRRNIIKNLVSNKLYGALWFKFCKSSLYKENDIKFINGADYSEDYACSVKIIHYSRKISYLQLPLYNYNRINVNSILNSMTNTEVVIKNVNNIETNNKSVESILSLYDDIEKEKNHRNLSALSLYLELEDKRCRQLWLSKCKISLFDIINDTYLSKGYRFKYSMVKLRLYNIYILYVRLKKFKLGF